MAGNVYAASPEDLNEINLTIKYYQDEVDAYKYQIDLFDKNNGSELNQAQQSEKNGLLNGLKESQDALTSNIGNKTKLQASDNNTISETGLKRPADSDAFASKRQK